MANGRSAGRVVAVALAVTTLALVLPGNAGAHGRGHGRGFAVGGFYRFNPYFGLGAWPYWGPYGWGWGPPPYYSGPPDGVDMNVAMIAGFGALEINAKPNRAEVWVDGKYIGEARDLDGYPTYLWLEEGPHTIAVYKGGYATFEERVEVQRGMKRKLKVRLEQGSSPPPGEGPGTEPSETRPDSGEAPKEEAFEGLFE